MIVTAFAKVFQRLEGESNDAFAERLAAAVAEDSKAGEEQFDEEDGF
jgi:hypothetical protein